MDNEIFNKKWKEIDKELLEGKITFRYAADALETYPQFVKSKFKKQHPEFVSKQEMARKKNKKFFCSNEWKEMEKDLYQNKTNYSKIAKSTGVDIMVIRKEFLKDYPDFSALGRKGRKVYSYDNNEKWIEVRDKIYSGEVNYQEASRILNIPWVSIRMRMQKEYPGFVSYKRKNKPTNTFLSEEEWQRTKKRIHKGEISLKKASEELNYNLSTLSKRYYSCYPNEKRVKLDIPQEKIDDILSYKSTIKEVANELGVEQRKIQSYMRYHYKDFSFGEAKNEIIKSRSPLSWEEIVDKIMKGELSYVKAGEMMGVSNNYVKRKLLKEHPDFESPLYSNRKAPAIDLSSDEWKKVDSDLMEGKINYEEASKILGVSITTVRIYFLRLHPGIKLPRLHKADREKSKKEKELNKKELDL